MEQLHFVYALMHNGNVFYIGRTNNLATRLKAHIGSASKKEDRRTPVGSFIKSIIDNKEYPEMVSLFCLPKRDAIRIETVLIMGFCRCDYTLYNFQFNWKTFKRTNKYNKPKEAYLRLAEIQQHQIDWYNTFILDRNPIYPHWMDNIL